MRQNYRGIATRVLPVRLKQNTAVLLKYFSGAVIVATLTACGGGGGGGTPPTAPVVSTTSVSGQVTDAVFPGANVVILSGSLSGAVLGTAIADSNGNYRISFPTPSGTTPIFVTATKSDGTATLVSYIGAASQLTGNLTSANLPNLNITHVTTSALALMQNTGVNLTVLTPGQYGQEVMQLNNAIIQLSGIVKDLVDQKDHGCAMTTSGPITLASLSGVIGAAPVSATSNLYTAVAPNLTSNCSDATMANLSSQVASDTQILGPELTDTAATAGTEDSISAGTYIGSVTPLITSVSPTTCLIGPTHPLLAVMTVANGSISLTSTTGPISLNGALTGANFTMNGTDPNPLQVTGAVVPLTGASESGFSINGTWTDTNNGCTYAGTYYAPALLSSGTASAAIPNGAYNNVQIQPVMLTSSNITLVNTNQFPATITINNGAITYAATNSTNDNGSGTVSGNTFTMTINACGGTNNLVATGTMYSLGTARLLFNGSYNELATASCPAQTGTFSGSN